MMFESFNQMSYSITVTSSGGYGANQYGNASSDPAQRDTDVGTNNENKGIFADNSCDTFSGGSPGDFPPAIGAYVRRQ